MGSFKSRSDLRSTGSIHVAPFAVSHDSKQGPGASSLSRIHNPCIRKDGNCQEAENEDRCKPKKSHTADGCTSIPYGVGFPAKRANLFRRGAILRREWYCREPEGQWVSLKLGTEASV